MRVNYWSQSKLAHKLRVFFDIPMPPSSATAEGWDAHEAKSKSASKFGNSLINALDDVQDIVMYVPDKLKSLTYFLSNVKNNSHALRTSVPVGTWSDLTHRIPDALMLSVVDFIEKECFWMNIMGTKGDSDVAKYARQSYVMRKLFPIHIDTETRAKHGFEWLDFQIDNGLKSSTKREIERHPYHKIKDAYLFAVGKYRTFDVYDEVGYDLELSAPFAPMTPEKREMFDKMRILEEAHEKEITKHCTNIVKYRHYLWT